MDIKGIPNLIELYEKKILAIEDIIEVREDYHGRKFRDFYLSNDYNEEKIKHEIFSYKENSKFKIISDNLRFYIPNIIGLGNTWTGIGAGLADKYLLSNLLKEWTPNFFLDNILKEKIDSKIKAEDLMKKKELLKKTFPNTGRNDKCPCGSGKKFKKCCGNI